MAFAAIVGCQKELAPVVGTEQAGNVALDQRPVLANTELTVGVDTRAHAGNTSGIGFVYDAGDKVGAMLIDEVDPYAANGTDGFLQNKTDKGTWTYADYVAEDLKEIADGKYLFTETYGQKDNSGKGDGAKHTGQAFYKITNDYIYSNYPYTTEDGSDFTTPAVLVEGHYMFYAPYNAGNGTRGPLFAKLPVEQNASEETKAVDDFYKGTNPVVVAATYLSAKNTSSVKVTPGHIFAYPKFTIKNTFNGFLFDGEKVPAKEVGVGTTDKWISTGKAAKYTMTIKQIEFYTGTADDAENLFAYERKVVPSALYETADWATSTKYLTTYTQNVANAVATSEYDFGEDAETEVNFAHGIANDKPKATQRIVVTLNKELAYNGEYSFYVVMPGADYTLAGLYARILVTIGDNDYYIVTNEVTGNTTNGYKYSADNVIKDLKVIDDEELDLNGYAYFSKTAGFGDVNDYQFADRHQRGSDKIELVRGQRWPYAEINEQNKTKGFAGELLTIELVGGMGQVALAAATEETKVDNGIKNNEAFIAFLKDKAHNSAAVKEVESVEDVTNEHTEFAFAKDNTVNIDAAVVEALQTELFNGGSLTLKTNLPIAAGVTVEKVSDDEFRFTAGGKSFNIKYESAPNAVTGDAGSKTLGAGINRVSVATDFKDNTLVMAEDAANAVVFIDATDVVVKNPAGINGIVFTGAYTMTVKATADVTAWIMDGGNAATIIIEEGSKGLTNSANNFDMSTITNSALATVAATKPGKVMYSRNGFGTEPIPAATNVNYVIINAASPSAALPVETATFDYVKNLKNVTIEFGANISTLESAGDTVTLGDHIKNVSGTVTWMTMDKINGTTVSHKADTFTLTEGAGVTFIKRQ